MNVLIDTSFFGGSGGLEKLVKDIILEKPEDMIIDIFISSGINSEISFKKENVFFKNIFELNYNNYDLYLKVGTNYDHKIYKKLKKECIKIINPAGYMHRPEFLQYFNFLWQESPNSYDLYENIKKITLCPPVIIDYKPLLSNNIVENVSKKFFVTAANDYDIYVKGIDIIYDFAENSEYDLVWFCSDNKLPTTNLKPKAHTPDKLKIAKNFPKNIIFDTIKKSFAYICFSRRESFSYSIAEAMMLEKPIITQKVGLVKYDPSLFYLYEDSKFNSINTFSNIESKNYSSITKNFTSFWNRLFESIKND